MHSKNIDIFKLVYIHKNVLYNKRLSQREISIKTIFFSILENNYYLIKNENVKVFLLENAFLTNTATTRGKTAVKLKADEYDMSFCKGPYAYINL